IVVRPLTPLADLAAEGKTVVFADLNPNRFQEEWAEVLGVASLPRRTYVNSGFLALPRAGGLELLERLEGLQRRMPLGTLAGPDGRRRRPFKYPDQDALNAVLA